MLPLRPILRSSIIMGKIRYIGSKVRIADQILSIIGTPKKDSDVLIDLFSGTGIISRSALSRGWKVVANDYLYSSSLITKAQLLSKKDVSFKKLGSYEKVINFLNSLVPLKGYIYREYSPSGKSRSGHLRKYFTTENATRIDAARTEIENLYKSHKISLNEYHLLIADLLEASNQVANIAGTYGCFLNNFASNSINEFKISPRVFLERRNSFSVQNNDSFKLISKKTDTIYIDPPYTKRQYPAYYHILETISYFDTPLVDGVTGLRPWKEKSSPFCFKKKAPEAFKKLLSGLRAKEIYISYSSEGHVSMDELMSICKNYGKTKIHELGEIGRYAPNVTATKKAKEVNEYLVHINVQ